MSDPEFDIETTTIAETDSMGIWKAEEPDGEVVYNVQLNNVTIHFFQEEYDEFVALIKQIK
ncbi:MAG TPA: hypothetical protein VJ965_04335 [Anaerolineales bacterium]|nr:hypothetical protein [Anaerolineales bacterium]